MLYQNNESFTITQQDAHEYLRMIIEKMQIGISSYKFNKIYNY